MRITFLGTSGSEGFPAAFCTCERCTEARRLGGKNVRRRSSVLINDDLLVDLGPDVPASLQVLGLSLTAVRDVVITHAHDDHFIPVTLKYRLPRYGAGDLATLRLHGSAPTLERLDTLPGTLDKMRLEACQAAPGQWTRAGRYRVLPLPARHAPELQPLIYVLFEGERGILYATDTGDFPDAAWAGLESVRLAAAILNCTFWEDTGDPDHLSVPRAIAHVQRLRASGILGPDAPVYVTHISHRSQPDHDTLTGRLAPEGIAPAYDGLEFSV
jgi:phosphoribosyl 1,2-cyclic phosphodiesterase